MAADEAGSTGNNNGQGISSFLRKNGVTGNHKT
jgi:hypothetical protein